MPDMYMWAYFFGPDFLRDVAADTRNDDAFFLGSENVFRWAKNAQNYIQRGCVIFARPIRYI